MQLCSLMQRQGLAAVATVGDCRVYAQPHPSLGTQALIYHRSAAQRIVREITQISAAIDVMLFKRMDVFGLRIVAIRPAPIEHAEFQSTIQFQGPKVRNKVWRELNRGMKCMGRLASFSVAWGVGRSPR